MNVEKDKFETSVIFRYWFPVDDVEFPWNPDSYSWGNKRIGEKARRQGYGEVIALFPEIPADFEGRHCQSFVHMGQHSGADYHGIIRTSVPATDEEIVPLKKELEENYGYNLVIRKKTTPKIERAYSDEFKRMKRENESGG